MRRADSQHNVVLLLGVMLLQSGLSDLHLRYVRAGMRPLLVASGVVLLLLGGLGMLGWLRSDRPDAGRDEHGAHAPPRTAWLLVLPFFVLVVAAPPSLGSYLAAREPVRLAPPPLAPAALAAPRDGAVDLTVTDFFERSAYAPDTVDGVPVRLVGFVTVVDDAWYVSRIRMSCCAADGRPVKVLALDAPGPIPEQDTWLEVVGTSAPTPAAGEDEPLPAIRISSMRSVEKPRQTYES